MCNPLARQTVETNKAAKDIYVKNRDESNRQPRAGPAVSGGI
jgi:hypothetical protein